MFNLFVEICFIFGASLFAIRFIGDFYLGSNR